jgi:septal ring factor EnvC (AmiA/AmiB activator)
MLQEKLDEMQKIHNASDEKLKAKKAILSKFKTRLKTSLQSNSKLKEELEQLTEQLVLLQKDKETQERELVSALQKYEDSYRYVPVPVP